MLEFARDVIHSVATPTGELAKSFATNSAEIARRVSDVTVDAARRVGKRRALYGLAAIGALFGTIMLVRYLRARAAAADNDADLDEDGNAIEVEDAHGESLGDKPRHKMSRAKRKAQRAMAH